MKLEDVRQMILEENFPLEFNPQEWEDFQDANCYPYVLGIKTNESFMIGDLIGERVTNKNSAIEIVEVLLKELEEIGFVAVECETTDYVEEDEFKIYLEIAQNGKYHLLRQDRDGGWSHKAVDSPPNRLDTEGYEIIDPDTVANPLFQKYCFLLQKEEE